MTLKTRPSQRHLPGSANAGPDDLSVNLRIFWPRTEHEWLAWRVRRHRFCLAIGVWALERAKTDALFHWRREWVAMVRRLGLTLADDAALEAQYRRAPAANGRRALAYRSKRGG